MNYKRYQQSFPGIIHRRLCAEQEVTNFEIEQIETNLVPCAWKETHAPRNSVQRKVETNLQSLRRRIQVKCTLTHIYRDAIETVTDHAE